MGRTGDAALALGDTVRDRRLQLGLTQEELAARCGKFRAWISDVECGRTNPTLTTLDALAEGLDVPLSLLFWRIEGHLDGGRR